MCEEESLVIGPCCERFPKLLLPTPQTFVSPTCKSFLQIRLGRFWTYWGSEH
jgi:hypothetical protein